MMTLIDFSIQRGDHGSAFAILETRYEPSWQQARTELRANQAETIANIYETESLAGWIGGATRFLAIILLPAIAIVIYRRIVSAQVRERRLEFEAKLEYERKLSASKDKLLAGVSHQLRTPVTGIYGMADLLSDRSSVDEQTVQEFVGAIRTEAQELDRMLADLLAETDWRGVEQKVCQAAAILAHRQDALGIAPPVQVQVRRSDDPRHHLPGPAREIGAGLAGAIQPPLSELMRDQVFWMHDRSLILFNQEVGKWPLLLRQ